MRARMSASQAWGSTPLSLAVWINVSMSAARSPPRSEPANSQDFLPSAIPRSSRQEIVAPRPFDDPSAKQIHRPGLTRTTQTRHKKNPRQTPVQVGGAILEYRAAIMSE